MVELFEYDFMQNALLAGLLVSVLVGVIGSLIVVNKITFLSGGIAHSSYGGIGIAIYLGLPILLGATIFSIVTAVLIALLTFENKNRMDAIIGMMWAAGMAIGIVFIDITPGYNVDLMSYLFGSIIAVSQSDIYFMTALIIFVLLMVAFFYKQILAVSYDMEFAKLRGINVKFFYTLILILSALCIVAAIRVVGLILVMALLTIPTYLAEHFCSRLISMMALSALFATLFTLSGLMFSYFYDISSGASIILMGMFGLIVVKLFFYFRN